MKINTRFLNRLFAGFVVATVVATSVPVSVFAEETAPVAVTAEVQAVEETSVDTTDEVGKSDTEKITSTEETDISDVSDSVADEETSGNDEREVTVEAVPSDKEDEEKTFFEEMTEAAQDALPVSSVITEQSPYGPTKIQWRSSATDPYVPSTTPGTIRYVTQSPSSPLFSASYWTNWLHATSYECGTTCQSMALSYLGVNLTPGQLLDLGGGVSRIGTSFTNGINGGYDHQGYPGCNGTDLKQAINNYLANKQTKPMYSPVMIHVNNYPATYGGTTVHYLLIIGVIDESKNIYQTLDPWDNTVTSVTLKFGTKPTASYTAFTSSVSADAVDEFYQFVNPKGSTGEIKPVTPDPETPSNPSTPDEQDTLVKVNNKDGVVLASDVNVRKGASTSYAILTTVDKYQKVVIVGKTSDWYKVQFTDSNNKTKTGYISKEYVGVGTRPSQPTISLKAYYNNRIEISWKKQSGVAGYKIQRYNTSTKKYKTIKTITSASTTSYMDTGLTKGKTYKYRVYAYKTWKRSQEYTVLSVASSAKSLKASDYMNAKTNGTYLNVRKGPGTNYGVVTVLKKSGVTVRVYALKNSWYKLKVQVNKKWTTGYISKSYVKL